MSRTRRAGKGNAATAPKPAAGARFDAKTRILDRAILLARQGRYSEAETYLREVLRLRPNDVEVLIELGAAVWRQRRWAEAGRSTAGRMTPSPTISGS
jgi:Flp pilus assembly protein TadD